MRSEGSREQSLGLTFRNHGAGQMTKPISTDGPTLLAYLLQNRQVALGASLVIATLVAAADYATGDRFPLLVCYLPSVMLACWVSNIAVGAALAMLCCTGWLVDDLIGMAGEELTADEVWTAASHGMCFAAVIGTLGRLRRAYDNERRMARTDGLTGLLNAKAFREQANAEILRAQRTGKPVSVAFLDCDNFKTVNDTLGHLEGDRLLAAIALEMRQRVRSHDVPARMGGDEFAILLPETREDDARTVIERVRESLTRRMQENDWPVTFSIGVAVYASAPTTVDQLLSNADQLMYEVKTTSKDDVVFRLVA